MDDNKGVPQQDTDSINRAKTELATLMQEGALPTIIASLPATPVEYSLPENIMKEYIRCVLGGLQFEHTFNVLNDQVMLTYKELSLKDSQIYNDIHMRLRNPEDYLLKDQLGIMLMLCKITTTGDIGVFKGIDALPEGLEKAAGDDLRKAINDKYVSTFSTYNEVFHRLIHRGYNKFLILLDKLSEKQLPENF